MPRAPGECRFKVILMGDPNVGKTCLVHRYVDHVFEDNYVQTLGTVITKHSEVFVLDDGRTVAATLMIWDIAGQKGFRELLAEAFFLDAQAALAVFDVTRSATLKGLQDWIDSARHQYKNMPIIVLGNKCDLSTQGRVTNDDAKEFCRQRDLPYFATSAKTGMNVQAAFRRISLEAIKALAPRTVEA